MCQPQQLDTWMIAAHFLPAFQIAVSLACLMWLGPMPSETWCTAGWEVQGNIGFQSKLREITAGWKASEPMMCICIMHGFLIWSSCHRKQSSITNAMAMPMNRMFVFAVQLRAGSGAAQQPTKSIQEHKSLKPCNSAECSWAGPSPEAVRHDRARNSALAARCLHRPSPRIEKWIKKKKGNCQICQVRIS